MIEDIFSDSHCKKCGSEEDLLMTEDGEIICEECFFYGACEGLEDEK